jgi:hypothetical protein
MPARCNIPATGDEQSLRELQPETARTVTNNNQGEGEQLNIRGNMKLKLRLTKAAVISSFIAVIGALALAKSAPAQIDPGYFEVFQNGVKAGEICVPARDVETVNYVEHWVLFNNYVYPGRDPELVTTIKVARRGYANEADFFARVPWGPGFRYVRVDSTDTDKLPGR